MSEQEEAIVRRAFERSVKIALSVNGDTHDRLCAFFGSMSAQAGCWEVSIDALRSAPAECSEPIADRGVQVGYCALPVGHEPPHAIAPQSSADSGLPNTGSTHRE